MVRRVAKLFASAWPCSEILSTFSPVPKDMYDTCGVHRAILVSCHNPKLLSCIVLLSNVTVANPPYSLLVHARKEASNLLSSRKGASSEENHGALQVLPRARASPRPASCSTPHPGWQYTIMVVCNRMSALPSVLPDCATGCNGRQLCALSASAFSPHHS